MSYGWGRVDCPPDLLLPLVIALEVLVCPPALAPHYWPWLQDGAGVFGAVNSAPLTGLHGCRSFMPPGGCSQIALVSLAHTLKGFLSQLLLVIPSAS